MTPFVTHLRLTLLLAAVFGLAGPAHVWSQGLQGLPTGTRSRVIVEFRGAPDVRIITGNGGVARRQLAGMNAQVADLDPGLLANVRRSFGLTGKGIGVAVIDSGITAWHDDLYLTDPESPRSDPRVVHFRDFTADDNPGIWASDQPTDAYGHGTHVAGVIAGNGFDSDGHRLGIAPEAHLIGLKVLDGEGNGYISDVIAALDYAVAVKDVYNIRVINLSVASGVFESYNTDPFAQAARRAVRAGIVVVAAAGNLGLNDEGDEQWGGITCPGNAPWVLTVGAASHEGTRPRSNDIVAGFSSRGPTWIDFGAKPDLIAPGVGTESLADPNSTLYTMYDDYLLNGTRPTPYRPYLSLSGTSMAAPAVAGTVALMLEANPSLTPNAVKALLQYTAEVRDDEPVLAQGAGLLNTLGAVRMARHFATPDQPLPERGDTIEDEFIAWSEHIIWGNRRVAGGVPLPGANAWLLTTTWGTRATATGRPIVLGARSGDNIVWSTRDDDNIVWSTNTAGQVLWPADHPVDDRRRMTGGH